MSSCLLVPEMPAIPLLAGFCCFYVTIPRSWVGCTYFRFSQLAAVAIVIIVYYANSIAGEAILNTWNTAKTIWWPGRGSAPDPARGAYSASPEHGLPLPPQELHPCFGPSGLMLWPLRPRWRSIPLFHFKTLASLSLQFLYVPSSGTSLMWQW